jgi:hypothetical protein
MGALRITHLSTFDEELYVEREGNGIPWTQTTDRSSFLRMRSKIYASSTDSASVNVAYRSLGPVLFYLRTKRTDVAVGIKVKRRCDHCGLFSL